MTYSYTAGANNGQMASSADSVTGETITYQYDSLKRLVQASSVNTQTQAALWSGSYTHDGFGNLTAMTPGGLSTTVNAAKNQIEPVNAVYAYDFRNHRVYSYSGRDGNPVPVRQGWEEAGDLRDRGNDWLAGELHIPEQKRVLCWEADQRGGQPHGHRWHRLGALELPDGSAPWALMRYKIDRGPALH